MSKNLSGLTRPYYCAVAVVSKKIDGINRRVLVYRILHGLFSREI